MACSVLSNLQCIECEEEIQDPGAPSVKNIEAAANSDFSLRSERKQRESKRKLYDIEIVEEDESRVKVHYYGYSSRYDDEVRSDVHKAELSDPAIFPSHRASRNDKE